MRLPPIKNLWHMPLWLWICEDCGIEDSGDREGMRQRALEHIQETDHYIVLERRIWTNSIGPEDLR